MEIQNKLLLRPSDIKPTFSNWVVSGVFNPGAIRLPNKKIMLLARVSESVKQEEGKEVWPLIISKDNYDVKYREISKRKILDRGRNVIYMKGGISRLTTISHFRRIILSEDGFNVENIEKIPAFVGEPGDGDLGVEDARIIKMGNHYLMTYVSVCLKEGVCTSLATSKNLKNWDRKGIIFRQQNKDVVLFPEKMGGEYVALHRPEGTIDFSKKSIWISHSPDLIYWGREKVIMVARPGSWGDGWIGSGPPPIKTKKGWLLFYHGAKDVRRKKYYAVGAALLDLKNPEKVLARTSEHNPLIKPGYSYEKKGFIDGVVFPTGAIETLDKKSILLFSGGGDRVITVKKIKIDDVLNSLEYAK
ncbi:MAG: hypothetical protein Q7S74_03330 [Nanoarchaeota archaeon]|nr:hypothetical protein [Nanoarchaeota archaeon]